MDTCPPLEDIAAFLDDRLKPEERERITEHLARCESCYEIFAGAVHFQEEERDSSAEDIGGGDVIPFPLAEEKDGAPRRSSESPRRFPAWLLLAASVVLATGLGYLLWQNSRVLPDVTVAGLSASLQGSPGIAEKRYQPENVDRGGPDGGVVGSEAPVFLAGVHLLDLRLSAQGGEVEDRKTILYSLSGALDQVLGMHSEAERLKQETDRLTDATALQQTAETWERNLESWNAEDPFFRFGLWTEAGRISAEAGSSGFFKERINRRFLTGIQREISSIAHEDDRYARVLEDLRTIGASWDSNERRVQDGAKLEASFRSIIEQMEEILKQDQIDESDPLS